MFVNKLADKYSSVWCLQINTDFYAETYYYYQIISKYFPNSSQKQHSTE